MNILLLGATGSIGKSVLSVIEQNKSSLNLFGIALNENTLDPKIINEHKEWILINDDFIFV